MDPKLSPWLVVLVWLVAAVVAATLLFMLLLALTGSVG